MFVLPFRGTVLYKIVGLYPVSSTKQFSIIVGTIVVSEAVPTLFADKFLPPERLLVTPVPGNRLAVVLKEKM